MGWGSGQAPHGLAGLSSALALPLAKEPGLFEEGSGAGGVQTAKASRKQSSLSARQLSRSPGGDGLCRSGLSALPALGAQSPSCPRPVSQEALVCMFLEAASIALTLAMRSCVRRDKVR